MKILKAQKHHQQKQERLANIENIKQTLIEKERLLTFFDKEEEIELQIEEKLKREKLLYGDKEVVKIEEEYVPPEIKKREKQ
jgi:small subunit ribosomal protein S27